MNKLILSFSIITGGLGFGYLVQQLVLRGQLQLPITLEALRKRLQKTALLFVMPFTVLSAVWIVDIENLSIAALPLFGFGAIMLGGVLALGAARLYRLPANKTGALYGCGSFTNIGSIGALICFIFLGEAGFALVPIYKIFEELTYYTIGFPIAKYFSTASGSGPERPLERVRALITDPFILAAVSSLATGGLLNLLSVPRPEFIGTINAVFIPVGTAMLLISIGLAMRFKSVQNYLKECFTVAAIKFVLVPATMSTLAVIIGYGRIQGGLPLKVIIILASMPVAFNALIPPSIYDLDLELANSCWFFTTAALVLVLPLLMLIIGIV
jgi:predicted permease